MEGGVAAGELTDELRVGCPVLLSAEIVGNARIDPPRWAMRNIFLFLLVAVTVTEEEKVAGAGTRREGGAHHPS